MRPQRRFLPYHYRKCSSSLRNDLVSRLCQYFGHIQKGFCASSDLWFGSCRFIPSAIPRGTIGFWRTHVCYPYWGGRLRCRVRRHTCGCANPLVCIRQQVVRRVMAHVATVAIVLLGAIRISVLLVKTFIFWGCLEKGEIGLASFDLAPVNFLGEYQIQHSILDSHLTQKSGRYVLICRITRQHREMSARSPTSCLSMSLRNDSQLWLKCYNIYTRCHLISSDPSDKLSKLILWLYSLNWNQRSI